MNMIQELLDEKVALAKPVKTMLKDRRYLVTLYFKIKSHTWIVRMKVNADDQHQALRIAYKIAKMDLKQASNIGVKYVRGDAVLSRVVAK